MLLEYGAKNFHSFKEGASISFRLDQNCPQRFSNGRDFTHILGVKGANGSGKTNVLKALSFICEFGSDSFSSKPEDEISITGFFYDESPSEFYIEFRVADAEYRYELSLTKHKVVREALFRTIKRKTLLFERQEGKLTECVKEFDDLQSIKIRNNASIISTAHQYEIGAISDVYSFFFKCISNVYHLGLQDGDPDYARAAKFFYEHPDYFEFAKSIMLSCDLGIKDIYINPLEDGAESKIFHAFFEQVGEGKDKILTYYRQSAGTKALFLYLSRYKWALKTGGVLIHDEFDTKLHPMILPKLLHVFLDPKLNPHDGQLLFTTHDSEILDFLGKYRTYLVNKEEGESYAYRLDEICGEMLRNDRPIAPLYNARKIGGVPNL